MTLHTATSTQSKPLVDSSQEDQTLVPSPSDKSSTKTETEQSSRPVLRPMDPETKKSIKSKKSPTKLLYITITVVVLLLGTASGYVLAAMQKSSSTGGNILSEDRNLKREVTDTEITKGTKVGIADESTFDDSTEGTLAVGGFEGEGSHHLIRPGGEDQTLYMTSSVIDLDQFDGRKVKVWGETIGAQKAGWLMDVGKLEVLE